MPPTQHFWEILFGDDGLTALPLGENSRASLKGKHGPLRDSRKWDAARLMPSKGWHLAHSEPLDTAADVLAEPDSDGGIECVLQMIGDELCRQPAVLHMQSEKIALAQDELAVQNCSLFLASSKALNSFRCSVENMSATLAEMEKFSQPLHDGLKQFRAESNAATSREASLHILVSMQRSVSQLLDLPSLVLNCCNGGLNDEAVDVLKFSDAKVAALRANGCSSVKLLDFLELQLNEIRKTCVNTMLRQLGQQTQLAASLKLVGPLRRLSCSEGQLRKQFLQRRDGDVACQRQNVEGECETELSHGLCAAAELLRGGVLQTAVHYRAIFGMTDGPLSAWLAQQVHWFVTLIRRELLQVTDEMEAVGTSSILGDACEVAPLESVTLRKCGGSASKFRLRLVDLANVYRQTYSAAWALHRVQCFFFPVVAPMFDRYVVAMHRQAIEEVAAAFAQSIDEYDYVPSLVYFSLLEGTPWFQSCIATNPCCLFLLRHAPLSNLYNSIAEVLNSFQECPISTAANEVVCLLGELIGFCIRKLDSVKPGRRQDFHNEIQTIELNLLHKETEREDVTTRQAEFFVMCDIFACFLVPTLCRHISTLIPSCSALSPESFCLAMEEAGLSACSSPFTEACITLSNGRPTAFQEALPDTHSSQIEQLSES